MLVVLVFVAHSGFLLAEGYCSKIARDVVKPHVVALDGRKGTSRVSIFVNFSFTLPSSDTSLATLPPFHDYFGEDPIVKRRHR